VREQFFLAAVAQNIKRLVRFLSQPTTALCFLDFAWKRVFFPVPTKARTTGSSGVSPLLLNLAHCGDVALDLVADMKQERAGVLQSPFDVRNNDVGPCAKTAPYGLYGKSQSHRMVASMQSENAFNLRIGVSLKFDLAGHFGGRGSNLGVALAFQDFCRAFCGRDPCFRCPRW
jgi:hypothetical protein